MTARTAHSLYYGLAGLFLFLFGSIIYSVIKVFLPPFIDFGKGCYFISLAICLLMVAHSFCRLSVERKPIWLAFRMFWVLSWSNLADEISFRACNIDAREVWIAAGVIFYFFVLINEAIIKKK